MLNDIKYSGEIAVINFDDTVPIIAIWACLAIGVACLGIFFTPFPAFFAPFIFLTPLVSAIFLVRGPSPRKRTLHIDRQGLLVTGTKGQKVRKLRVGAFQHVLIQSMHIPKGGTVHQVRIMTNAGAVLVSAFFSRTTANEVATELATWLNVKLLDGGDAGLFGYLHDLRIWR